MSIKKHIAAAIAGTAAGAFLLCACQGEKEPVYSDPGLIIVSPGDSASDNEQSSEPVSSESEPSSEPGSSEPESSEESSDSKNSPRDHSDIIFNPGGRSERLEELESKLVYIGGGQYELPENARALSEDALFVGDSICRGFAAFSVTEPKNVFAAGSVAARNFFEMDVLYYGKVQKFEDVLGQVNPKRVFFWMGTNDVNMTESYEYCDNYRKLIDFTLANSEAEVYVCAITPVNSNFASNSRIDEFNAAIDEFIPRTYAERVGYVDFGYMLKDSDNRLAKGLDSGDGIHLAPEVYYMALMEICDQLGIN